MTKEHELVNFNFSDINEMELQNMLSFVEDKAIQQVFRTMTTTQLSAFIDFRGFRLENTPLPKIRTSTIKGVLAKKTEAVAFANTILFISFRDKPIYEWIKEYRETHDLELLFTRLQDMVLEEKIQTQPIIWIKAAIDDNSTIPDHMKVKIDIDLAPKKLDQNPVTTVDTKTKKTIEKPAKKSKEIEVDQISKLKKEIADLKEKHKLEIESIKREQSSNYTRYLDRVRLKINQMIAYAADVELTKVVEKNELKTVEQVWSYLASLENQIGVDLDSSDVRRNLQKIAVMKFMVLAGKDEN